MIGGSTMNGAYSNLVKVPLSYIHKLKKNISMDDAAIIEPMCVAYNAVINNSNIKKNSFTVIFGGGTIAIMCAKMINFFGDVFGRFCDVLDGEILGRFWHISRKVFFRKGCQDGRQNGGKK